MAMSSGFGDILAARVAERESQIVLGLDPDPEALWPGAHEEGGVPRVEHSPAWRAAVAVRVHCCALIDAAAPACVAVKPQLACFERLGAPGWEALEAVVEHARQRGLLVIADGKRGDVPVTAKVYGQALFEGLRADLATVNPLLGRDAIEPFVTAARAAGAGVLLLVRTSNQGAADVQDLELAAGGRSAADRSSAGTSNQGAADVQDLELAAGGRSAADRSSAGTVWERLAGFVRELGAERVGASGLSDVGAVVGATEPRHLARARELMPHAVLLLPGVGAQGGQVQELAAAFSPGRAGGLITASRSIVGAHLATGANPAEAARAEAERLRQAAWALGV
jgi:orotidine-5'-phosphate decarboxylase